MGIKDGIEEDLKTDPPCHPRACALQDCIQKSNFSDQKCQVELDALYECCNQFYKKNGDNASSVCCPKPDVLRKKLEDRSYETAARKNRVRVQGVPPRKDST